MHGNGNPDLVEQAIALARLLQERAGALQTPAERRKQAELARMLAHPGDKATLLEMTDQAFRSASASRTVDQFTYIVTTRGIPKFFSPLERGLLNGLRFFGNWWPELTVPLLIARMRQQSASVMLPAESAKLAGHLRTRQKRGVRVNVNFLGESLLGESEARHRMERYLAALESPDLEVLSVKISTLYSQISALAREQTIAILCDRLELLYLKAAQSRFTRSDGQAVSKFVYLDMEEYRDMHLTAEAFMRTLDRPGLEAVRAGIALQAYLPDAARVQREINSWARRRFEKGGAPVTVRIVKGANLEMERVEASIRGWPLASYLSKRETDANFKRMLHQAMESMPAIQLGIGSHNLFDLAYGLLLANEAQPGSRIQFEMLEGMANHERRALFEQSRNLLLYAPACRNEEFVHAIGYLIRRLDENTAPDNFLSHLFDLEVGTPAWERLENAFRESCHITPSDTPRRTQDRRNEPWQTIPEMSVFQNEPDTDFSLPHNGEWARDVVAHAKSPAAQEKARSLLIDATGHLHGNERAIHDPSSHGFVFTHYREASAEDAETALVNASSDPRGWCSLSVKERSRILGAVAAKVRAARARLIAAAIRDGGKTFMEADSEVSEAVDFIEFYRASASQWHRLPALRARGKGVVLVVSPWNFPIAIPCGAIAAALATGNTVVFKPSSDTVLVAAELWRCFIAGGIPLAALQFLPCPGGTIGKRLAGDPRINAVLLTGGTETAEKMLNQFPGMPLIAETGGKNATIVTALSDREQAIRHVIHSAFSHSGQKCSATSLLLLEDEVFHDPEFKRTLCDAASSLQVGPAWDLATRVGPLIRPPSGALAHALKNLEPGESWALQPKCVGENPNLWSPGIKWGVDAGSPTHLTELFGPVLGVMRFSTLEEAIELVHQTGYGLTSGLESLDDREQRFWRDRIRAGNLYINRPTTGAIVLRQPFGGMAKSGFGPGFKTGGPNYLVPLLAFEESPPAAPVAPEPGSWLGEFDDAFPDHSDRARIHFAFSSYAVAWRDEFSVAHDHFHLRGEDNIRRYLPFCEVRLRVDARDSLFEIVARIIAGEITGARVVVSCTPGQSSAAVRSMRWGKQIAFVEESDVQLAQCIRDHGVEQLRFAASDRVPAIIRSAAAQTGLFIADAPVHAEGRIELLWYLREQSLSFQYHRHGNCGRKSRS